ncbi:DNA-directed RNA polymerase II subunit 4 isoform X3 [Tasmannia lanceolata]|uniref:DNA-directed RNA polymerase II subunit 4 isoform X3 n=1 Tax=Tasmannia lanceolata TaxID=3420 RepID=UPI0040648590
MLKMSGEEEENAAELKIGTEFEKAKCLMNCEVALILDRKYEQLQQMSDDPMNQISQVFEKSLQYVKRFSRYKNPDAVRQVREYPFNFQKVMLPFSLLEGDYIRISILSGGHQSLIDHIFLVCFK